MKNTIRLLMVALVSLMCFCSVLVDSPTGPSNSRPTDKPANQRIVRKITGFFPFEDNSNIWHYTESGSNTVIIKVTDTISDDKNMYFKVSFRENRVDTTDDWFLRSGAGIYYGQSLRGGFDLFLPATIDSLSGSYACGGSTVSYTYFDSQTVNSVKYYGVLQLRYNRPFVHGFDEITLAEAVGIISLIDHNGRWPISYAIDSCSVGGVIRKF